MVSIRDFKDILLPDEHSWRDVPNSNSGVNTYIQVRLEDSTGKTLQEYKTPITKDTRKGSFLGAGSSPEQIFKLGV